MSIDTLFRAIGAVACAYTFGLLVTVTSTAALTAAAHEPGAVCGPTACSYATQHLPASSASGDYRYSHAIHTAALFIAGE
jgi:hypothetical protein